MAVTTVLVIDDEPQIRRVVRNALAAEDTRVLEAASGTEGIDTAAAERPDLVILDLGLADTVNGRWQVSFPRLGTGGGSFVMTRRTRRF